MNKIYNDLFNINPKISTSLCFLLGLILTDNLNAREQNVLGNWIMLLAQTIVTNSSSQNIIESRLYKQQININSKEFKSMYNPIYYNIENTKEIIKKFYSNNSSDIDILIKMIKDLEAKINKIKED